ncbi:uncharacterized protein LOC124367008 isoform X3 [Homalodisca vitripennis]|nr:uncharacterized protein LOC124367008 isoform X3 [Homalodisca vitripennis]
MLHTITQRFLEEDTNPSLVLQDILLDFPIGDYNEVYLEDCKYPSDDMKVEIVSEEIEDIHQSQIKEESDEGQSEDLQEDTMENKAGTKIVGAFRNRRRDKTKKNFKVSKSPERNIPVQEPVTDENYPLSSNFVVYHENDIPAEVFGDLNSSVREEEDSHSGIEDFDVTEIRQRAPQIREVIADSEGYMYNRNRTVNGTVYLRCSRAKFGCRATAVMREEGKVEFTPSHYTHNHQPNPRRIMIRKFVIAILAVVKKEARKPEREIRPFREIYNQTISRYPIYAPYVNYKMVHRAVKRAKVLY